MVSSNTSAGSMVIISAMSLAMTKVLAGVAACSDPVPSKARVVKVISIFLSLITRISSMVVSFVYLFLAPIPQTAGKREKIITQQNRGGVNSKERAVSSADSNRHAGKAKKSGGLHPGFS